MDRLILVHYINYQSINSSMDALRSYYEKLDNINYDHYIVPTNSETKIECINPKLIDKEEYEKVRKIIEDVKNNAKNELR